MYGRALLLSLALLSAGCLQRSPQRAVSAEGVLLPIGVLEIERAHGADAWRAATAVQCELTVDAAEDGRRLEGVLTFTTHGTKSRLDLRNGTTLIFDGQRAWSWPPTKPASDARFNLLAWPYFLAVPFKLRDPGVNVSTMGQLPLGAGDRMYGALRLTFDPGTGDSPRDWYLLYRDLENNRLKAMAFVSTEGLRPGDLPDDPHAIVYDDFKDVPGAPPPYHAVLATHWTFYHWTPGAGGGGIDGDPVGHASLANLHFTTPPDGFFDPPPGAREDAPPRSQ